MKARASAPVRVPDKHPILNQSFPGPTLTIAQKNKGAVGALFTISF